MIQDSWQLPLEQTPHQVLRLYLGRLGVFALVIAANALLLGLVVLMIILFRSPEVLVVLLSGTSMLILLFLVVRFRQQALFAMKSRQPARAPMDLAPREWWEQQERVLRELEELLERTETEGPWWVMDRLSVFKRVLRELKELLERAETERLVGAWREQYVLWERTRRAIDLLELLENEKKQLPREPERREPSLRLARLRQLMLEELRELPELWKNVLQERLRLEREQPEGDD